MQVGTENTWAQINSQGATHHTLALRVDGSLWAWGANFYGGLGDGTTTNRSSPVPVGIGTTWRQISTGDHFSTAIAA